MAGSRLEKLGSVFTRMTSLLKTGVIKEADKPTWYDVMAAFPPKIDPKFDRFLDETPVPEMLYEEDKVRAKYYDSFKCDDIMDLSNVRGIYSGQKFLNHIKSMKTKNQALDDNQAFEIAGEEFHLQRQDFKL